MDKIRIRGGRPLQGKIAIGGAKNAALPLLAASLLTDETMVLGNLPHLADIATMTHLLAQHGTDLSMAGELPGGGPMGQVLKLRTRNVVSTEAPYDIVRKMRASVLVLGPLLARCGRARVSLPGGCAIGTRPYAHKGFATGRTTTSSEAISELPLSKTLTYPGDGCWYSSILREGDGPYARRKGWYPTRTASCRPAEHSGFDRESTRPVDGATDEHNVYRVLRSEPQI